MLVRILLVITTAVAAVVKEVSIEDYPWQVSIEKNEVHTCGGTMLRSLVLMTAGHCVYGVRKESLQVRAGTSTREKGGEVRRVKTIFEHPDYNPVTFENDVAILELDSAFDSTRLVDLLHSDNPLADDAVGLVIGWGICSSEDGGSSSPNLKTVELPIVREEKCAEVYPNFNSTIMICFGGNGGGDSCLSDSGGPILVRRMKHLLEQVGIVSHGFGCGEVGKPGVYTRVTAFQDFISESSCKPYL